MLRMPQMQPMSGAAGTLERMPGEAEPPTVVDAQIVEDATLRARPVPPPDGSRFTGFLDGVQRSEQVATYDRRVPIVEGAVAAAIRIRQDRRLATWRAPIVEYRLYAPFAYVPRATLEEEFPEQSLSDTTMPDRDGVVPHQHPVLLLERAKLAVSRDRELAERRLAESWCSAGEGALFIDGGIGGSDIVASAPCAVGVIKTHRTLYVQGGALDTVLSLPHAWRSSVVKISPRGRHSVYSWYLRLRDPRGHDALWGTVRIEIAETERVTERADEVSQWVLAETAPNAMPDARWDKMAYGVRNCEEFLRAIL